MHALIATPRRRHQLHPLASQHHRAYVRPAQVEIMSPARHLSKSSLSSFKTRRYGPGDGDRRSLERRCFGEHFPSIAHAKHRVLVAAAAWNEDRARATAFELLVRRVQGFVRRRFSTCMPFRDALRTQARRDAGAVVRCAGRSKSDTPLSGLSASRPKPSSASFYVKLPSTRSPSPARCYCTGSRPNSPRPRPCRRRCVHCVWRRSRARGLHRYVSTSAGAKSVFRAGV